MPETDSEQNVRDYFSYLTEAVKKVKRVRYTVKKENNERMSVLIILGLAVGLGAVLLGFIKSNAMRIAVGAAILAAICVAIAIMIISWRKEKKAWYCYYANTDDGIFCMSVVEDRAVVFAYDTAYIIDGERFYTLDGDGFSDYFDGEGSGLYSALRAGQGDVEYSEDTDDYVLVNRKGGVHYITIKDGAIPLIVSEQPELTDRVDEATGERVTKIVRYTKSDPQEDFVWEVPAFVEQAFEKAGLSCPIPALDNADKM